MSFCAGREMVGGRTEGMGVGGPEASDWKEDVRRRWSPAAAALAIVPLAIPSPPGVRGPSPSSPGRLKPAREPGRDEVEELSAAASEVNMYLPPPPTSPPPLGVLDPLDLSPLAPPRLSRLSLRASRIRRSSLHSSNSARVSYRSRATSRTSRPSDAAASYTRRSLVIRHCEPGPPGTFWLGVDAVGSQIVAGQLPGVLRGQERDALEGLEVMPASSLMSRVLISLR